MISRAKLYKYNQQTLSYDVKVVKFREFLAKLFRFLGIATLLSIVVSVLFVIFFGSPIEKALEYKANSIKKNYIAINNDIDSLEKQLHSSHFIDDQYYRELLELDSIPTPVRLAGIGGSESPLQLENYPYNEIITSTEKNLSVIVNQVKVQNESYRTIFKEAVIYNKELVTIPAILPINPAKHLWISSYYGKRTDPFTHLGRRHEGIDFAGAFNTEIHATADGEVSITKVSRRGYGKEVVISHSFGYTTRYAHLNKILVKRGQKVKRGELIGLMGSTGRSTGTHLHYEVRLNNRPVNPIYYYSDDLSTEEYEMIVKLSMSDKD